MSVMKQRSMGSSAYRHPHSQWSAIQYNTPEDFQDSEDEDAVLLRKGEIMLPTMTRHQRYTGSQDGPQPYATRTSYGEALAGGQHYTSFTGWSNVAGLHRDSSCQKQNLSRSEKTGRANQDRVFRGHHLATQGRQPEGQGFLAKGQGHLGGYDYLERGEGYGLKTEKVTGLGTMWSKGKVDKQEFCDLTLDEDQPSGQDQSGYRFEPHESLARQTTSSDRGCPKSSSYATRLGQQKIENTRRQPHKQGQVFAWQVTSKGNEATKSAFGKDVDVTLSGQSGDRESQDSKSDSPCIPRARDFVFARQMYEDNTQKKTVRRFVSKEPQKIFGFPSGLCPGFSTHKAVINSLYI
ncbi:uncharacterized protein LOC135476874 [Liolophura sinensis]|uniref:uncharacterized protein LOC135476874 n=1 Tax=Liolophura sinensis TaxID=3198878 RepID=UPI003158F504